MWPKVVKIYWVFFYFIVIQNPFSIQKCQHHSEWSVPPHICAHVFLFSLSGPGHPVLNCGPLLWMKLSLFSINWSKHTLDFFFFYLSEIILSNLPCRVSRQGEYICIAQTIQKCQLLHRGTEMGKKKTPKKILTKLQNIFRHD